MSAPAALRKLDPVEPIKVPSRLSQTFLRHANRCQRSAYLYSKWKGGAPSEALDGGTAAHMAWERCLRLMVEQEEERIPPDMAKDIMAEVIRERGDLTVPAELQDRLRQQAYHFAEGVWIDPSKVVAIEKKFVMDVAGVKVVGKIDVAFIDDVLAEVWDWKGTFAMTSQDELATKLSDGRLAAKSFQGLLYILLLAGGNPVTEVPCEKCMGTGGYVSAAQQQENGWFGPGTVIEVDGDPRDMIEGRCSECEGRGVLDHLEPPLGEHCNTFRSYEMYPQYLFEDGLGRRGPFEVTRPELIDHRLMLEGLVTKMAAAFESWEFPAVPGSHCSECPASSECPLPAHLRAHRGTINSAEEASEAAERVFLDERDLKARKKELRTFASLNGPIRYGADRVMDFTDTESRSTDWDGLEDGVERAVQYGEPFDLEEHRKVSKSTRFRDRKLEPHELAPAKEDEPARDWGDDAPW